MKLIGFKIRNIKSIKDTGWCHLSKNDNITVFAGQNEAGKSALLEGLNFFRNGSTAEFERLSKRTDSTHPYVECEFQLEEEDRQGNPDIINILGKLTNVRMYRGDVTKDDYGEIRLSAELMEIIEVELRKIVERGQERLGITKVATQKATPKKEDAPAEEVTPVPSPEPLPGPEELKKEIYQHFINHLPEFIYYDSFFSILPGTVRLEEIAKYKAIDDFQKVFHINFEEVLKKNTQARSSDLFNAMKEATVDLNTYWKQKQTTEEDDHYQYDIHLNPNEADQKLSVIEFLIHRNDGVSLFIEQKSKGFQWFSSFNLRLKALGVDSGNEHKFLILIDEPGQGLHETAQADVKAVLEELGKGGMQIAYTTHNPCLIGVSDEEILRIRLVYQTRRDGTKIKNIAQYSSSEGSQDALSPIITAMGINSVGQILDRAVMCVALEGITDHYYLTAMKKVLDIKESYSFIPAVGVTNIRPLVSILIGWEANFKAVFDDGEGKKTYKDLSKFLYPDDPLSLKKRVMKLDGFDGIEDLFSEDDFDKYVVHSSRTDRTIKNSAIAKTKKKELLARLFLEKVNTDLKAITLSRKTIDNFQKIFDWLKGTI